MTMEAISHGLVAVWLLAQTAAWAAESPEPFATRQKMFAIPFRIEKSDDPGREIVEAHLYVSSDRGNHWQLYAKSPLSQQHFMFRVAKEGEYWFAIRTLDKSGKVRPETITEPGLRVLVDTTPPKLKLSAQPAQGGQVLAQWEVEELYPKPESLTLQYRASFSEPWQPVAIEPHAKKIGSGQVAFWPKLGIKEIELKAEVSDMAGNPSVARAKINLEQAAAPQPGEAFHQNRDSHLAATQPDDNKTNSPVQREEGSVAIAINPAIGANVNAFSNRQTEADPAVGIPPGQRPKMVNSRLFELEYEVDSVGPSGIGKVELWGTRDGGKTWRSFAIDNDNQSPMLVSVEEEGIYGFRVVVTNGAGLGVKPPIAGDTPDLWIGVDLTRPTARIVSAEQGVGEEAGQMIISWQADDKMLAPRPVSLAFGQSRVGPWVPIASGLENTGRYAWTIDNRMPAKLFLRLEVRDEAGNLGVDELSEPVAIDQSRPTARLRSVHPVGQNNLER